MKKMICLILIASFTSLSFGQNTEQANKALIKDLIQKSFDEIWSGLNPDKIDSYYTKDFLLLEHGEVWNIAIITTYLNQARLSKNKPQRVNSIEDIDIKVGKETAWIAYHNYATLTFDDGSVKKLHWLESATALHTEEGWKLEMLHSTRMKADGGAHN